MCGALSVLALSALTACIEVRDLGTHWNRGTTDSTLAGRWRQERAEGLPEDDPVEFTIAIDGGEYRIRSDRKDDPPILARTLTAGSYTFLMTDPGGRSEAVLFRYALRRDVVQLYDLESASLRDWLRRHDPMQRNLHLDPVGLDVLDEAAVELLSQIPDEARYWAPADGGRQRYRKLP